MFAKGLVVYDKSFFFKKNKAFCNNYTILKSFLNFHEIQVKFNDKKARLKRD